MLIDRNEFARTCVQVCAPFEIDATHYLLAIAELRSGIADGENEGRVGPFGFTPAQWAALAPESPLRPSIDDWTHQCWLAARWTAGEQGEFERVFGRAPMVFELAERQWSISRQDLQRALDAVAPLVTELQPHFGVGVLSSGDVLRRLDDPARQRSLSDDGSTDLSGVVVAAGRDISIRDISVTASARLRSGLATRLRRATRVVGGAAARVGDLARALPSVVGESAALTTGLFGILVASGGDAMAGALRTLFKRRPEPPDERRVDLALLQMDGAAVSEADSLVVNQHYRVRVHIGDRAPESLLPEPAAPIASLLPESKTGHQLEVSVFGKDFIVIGRETQPLYLPPGGPSETLFFEVATPERVGPAELRVAVYYRNHLVQSFTLGALVARTAQEADRPVRFTVEFSRTAKFENLDRLGPRALSLAVNANGAATHGLFIKSEQGGVEFPLPQQLIADQLQSFRNILAEATSDRGNPRFTSYPDPDKPIPADFHRYVVRFADYGRDLYRAIAQRRPELLASFRRLAASEGKTIQIVRFDPNFVLPWAAIYDFKLPTPIEGAPVPEVCRGIKTGTDGKVVPCGHGPADGVYCINGFWGVRHVIEELIGTGVGVDAIDTITRARRDGAVRLAVDKAEKHTDEMQQKFETVMGACFKTITPQDVLLDLLWRDAERPALLIILGHLETKRIVQEPIGRRIVLPKGWLLPGEIVDRVLNSSWEQPHTLVLLMGCQTSLAEIGTLSDFGAAFNSARAAGVVGTEVVAFSRLLTRFATEVALALWHEEKLGPAITGFRRRLLVAGNPLAFVFSALGGADIQLSLGKSS